MNQNDTIDVNNDVPTSYVCMLSDRVHSIRDILTSDLERNMTNDGSIVTIVGKQQRARKQMRTECVSTMNGSLVKSRREPRKRNRKRRSLLKEDKERRSCGLDRAVLSLNSVRGFRQLRMRRICIIKWCFSCMAIERMKANEREREILRRYRSRE